MAERADITVTIDGDAVGALVSASVEVTLGTLEAAAEEAYGFARRVPGVASWSASASAFLAATAPASDATDAMLGALASRAEVAVVVTLESGETETGTALVTAWDAEAAVGAAVTGSFQLTGTGPLTLS